MFWLGYFCNFISVTVCFLYKIRSPNLLSASLMNDNNMQGSCEERVLNIKREIVLALGSGMRKFKGSSLRNVKMECRDFQIITN